MFNDTCTIMFVFLCIDISFEITLYIFSLCVLVVKYMYVTVAKIIHV